MKNLAIIILCFLLYSENSFAQNAAKETVKNTAEGAVAGAIPTVTGEATKAAKSLVPDNIKNGIGDFFSSSGGVAVMAGISTVMSGMLYKAAAAQEDEANANIVKIDRIMAEFKDSFVFYCPNGRELLAEPNCYCYNEDGTQNSTRTNSQTCKDLWAKNQYKLSATAGDYGGVSKFVDPVGCLNVNGAFDVNCNCKKLVDAKGNNACVQSSSITIPNNSFGASLFANTGVKDTMALAANSSNGNPNFAAFNTGVLGLKAIQAKQFNANLLRTISSSSNPNGGFKKVDEQNVLQLARAAIGNKAMDAAIANSKSALDIGNSGAAAANSSPLLKSAAAKAGIAFTGGNGLQNKKVNAKEGMNLNFGGEGASGAPQTQNFPEKDKNYNYKNSDISKNTGASIFELISNRYIQSGLKRLFEN